MRSSPNCERVRFQVSLELDGELSELEEAMVEAHVEHCGDCRAYRDDLHAITREVRETALERTARPIELPPRRRAVAAPLKMAAVAAIVATLGLFGTTVGLMATKGPSQPRLQVDLVPASREQIKRELRLLRVATDQRNSTAWHMH
jgi:predicted anti-sigma-YlaC factor YlaD